MCSIQEFPGYKVISNSTIATSIYELNALDIFHVNIMNTNNQMYRFFLAVSNTINTHSTD